MMTLDRSNEATTAAPELPTAARGLRITPRRPGRALLGLLLVAASVATAMTIYLRIGDRMDVLVAARPVLAGQQIEPSDLRVVSVSIDGGLSSVPATDRALFIGRYAKVRIASGTLIVDANTQLDPLVSDDRVLMSVAVPLSGVPIGLRERSRLALIVTPSRTTATANPTVLVEATVAAVPSDLASIVGGEVSRSASIALSVEVPPEHVALVGSAESIAVGVLDPSAPFPDEQETP